MPPPITSAHTPLKLLATLCWSIVLAACAPSANKPVISPGVTLAEALDVLGLPDDVLIITMHRNYIGAPDGYSLTFYYDTLALAIDWIYETDQPASLLGNRAFCPDANNSMSTVSYNLTTGMPEFSPSFSYWGRNYTSDEFATYDDTTGTWTINCF